jgi:hypothetical protein
MGALLSKEAAVTVAPMIFVADLLIRPKPCGWRSGLVGALRRTAPFFLLCLLLVALVLASGMVERYSASASLGLFGRHVPRHAAGYLAWMLFPFQTAGNVPGVSEDGWMGEAFLAVFHTARVVAVLGVGWLLWRGSTRQRLLCLWLLCAIAPYTIRTTMFPRYAYLATALFSVMVAGLAAGFLERRPAHAWLLRAAAAVFVATGLFLVYFSPSVAAFKGYARAAQPLIAQVRERRAEMATASQLWLIDPPPFAPHGLHPRDRMWSQIAGAVRDGPIPTHTLSRTEWELYLSRDQVPPGVQAYWWHEGQLRRVR